LQAFLLPANERGMPRHGRTAHTPALRDDAPGVENRYFQRSRTTCRDRADVSLQLCMLGVSLGVSVPGAGACKGLWAIPNDKWRWRITRWVSPSSNT